MVHQSDLAFDGFLRIYAAQDSEEAFVKRITLFAKGNVDVHDSLHSCRIGGQVTWNGVNEVERVKAAPARIRVIHETSIRTDALLAATGEVPDIVPEGLPLGAYPLASQFSTRVFSAPVDARIFSIQSDVTASMLRHRQTGRLIYPNAGAGFTQAQRRWMNEAFESAGRLQVDEIKAAWTELVERLQSISDAPILFYNLSALIPGDSLHCHQGFDDTFSTRIRRFNLALIELSQSTGVSIVDVDAVVAKAGGDRLKLDAVHLTAEGYRLVAEEVVRILDDLGVFEKEG